MRDDEQFENYLREFTPRLPAPLRVTEPRTLLWRRLAAAAGIVTAFGASIWFGHRKPPEFPFQGLKNQTLGLEEHRGQITLGELRRLANDPEELDTALADASRQELPDFRESTSALRVLAKE